MRISTIDPPCRQWLGLLTFVDNCSMRLTTAKLISIGHLPANPAWNMARHSHPFHELIIVLGGQISVEIQSQTRQAQTGELLWYPAGIAHREWTHATAPAETLFVSWRWLELPESWPLQQTDTLGRISQMARWLFADRESRSVGHPLLHAILAEYDRLATHTDDPLVTGIRTHIRQHLADRVTLIDLAKQVGLSKFHLVRRYRKLTGRTPMADVRLLRLQTARDLLLTTVLPLKEIAPRVGLGDVYRLCRLFRQHFQTTPGALRHR